MIYAVIFGKCVREGYKPVLEGESKDSYALIHAKDIDEGYKRAKSIFGISFGYLEEYDAEFLEMAHEFLPKGEVGNFDDKFFEKYPLTLENFTKESLDSFNWYLAVYFKDYMEINLEPCFEGFCVGMYKNKLCLDKVCLNVVTSGLLRADKITYATGKDNILYQKALEVANKMYINNYNENN